MRIGVNLLYLIPGKVGGTETYARELIPHLSRGHQLILFCDIDAAPTFEVSKNIEIVTLPIHSRARLTRLVVEQTLLPFLCKKYQVDVLFSLGYSAPVFHPCPSVVTIHDLNWYYHKEDFGVISRLVWQVLTRLSARYSDHIITDSHASADSICDVLNIPKSKISAILHATPQVMPVEKLTHTRPYLFTVLADYPHKNLATLLQAFEEVAKVNKGLDLIICGLGKQASSTTRVHYLGYVTRHELAALYAGATVFVFPSAYEGFGYPVLEAMSYGAPVISSNAYALSEVVGGGGVLLDPYDTGGYVKAITQVVANSAYREDLISRGYKRASELKWETTSRQTIEVLKKVVAHE